MRTSATGWRIVATGTLIVVFGLSALMNQIGSSWLALILVVAGTGVIIWGRQQ